MVISSKENDNVLLGQEWIHNIEAIPSTLHQRIFIWGPSGIIKINEADQSYYMADIKHVNKNNFDKNLAKMPPCYPAETTYTPHKDTLLTFIPLIDLFGIKKGWEMRLSNKDVSHPLGGKYR